MYTYIN